MFQSIISFSQPAARSSYQVHSVKGQAKLNAWMQKRTGRCGGGGRAAGTFTLDLRLWPRPGGEGGGEGRLECGADHTVLVSKCVPLLPAVCDTSLRAGIIAARCSPRATLI